MPQITARWLVETEDGDTGIQITVPMEKVRDLRDQLWAASVNGEDTDQLVGPGAEFDQLSQALAAEYQDYQQRLAKKIADDAPVPASTSYETDQMLRAAIRVGYLAAHGVPATIDSEVEL